MLRTINDLEGYAIRAIDGDIGHVKDVYFDDVAWGVRYLIVDTGSWLSSRKVLISPITIGDLSWIDKVLPVSITKDQVKNSPNIDTDKPVSRQHEISLLEYYGYPYYWGGAGMWGGGANPGMMLTGYSDLASPPHVVDPKAAEGQAQASPHQHDDIHLRSCNAVIGYHIQATDGDIGHVQGLLVDQETWAIRYMIVDTSNWWFGHQVLIATQWIQDVSWPDARVYVNLTRQAVKDAPPYDPLLQLDRQAEMDIYEHYGRAGYWVDEAAVEEIKR